MPVNELTDASLRAYRALGGPALRLTAVPALFGTAAIYFIFDYVLPLFGQTSDPSNINTQIAEAILVLVAAVGVALPLVIFATSYSSALISSLVSEYIVGNLPSPETARTAAFQNMGKLFKFGVREAIFGSGGIILGALLLMWSAVVGGGNTNDVTGGAAAGLGILALIAGFIVLPIVYGLECLAVPAILVEGLSVSEAAKRSRLLMRPQGRQPSGLGYVLNTYSILVLLLIFMGVGISAAIGMGALFESFSSAIKEVTRNEVFGKVLEIIPIFLTVWLLIPVWATTTTILYFERRVRLEGYDIETLGRDVWSTHKSSRFQL
jgi:hypothetical protein